MIPLSPRVNALCVLGLGAGCGLLFMGSAMAAGSLDEIGAHLNTTTTNVTEFAEKYVAKIVGTIGVLSTGFLIMRDRSGSAWKASLATTCVATVIIKYAPKVVTGLFGWV